MYQRQATFGEAVRSALVENYCNFSGRASRSQYWWYALFGVIVNIVVSCFRMGGSTFGTIICGIIGLALLLPSIGICVRRLHDIGKSGWWYLIVLIPLVGAIILIVWFCQPSFPGENEYGPEPLMVD